MKRIEAIQAVLADLKGSAKGQFKLGYKDSELLLAEIARLKAEVELHKATLRMALEWQPIDSAPKDGTQVFIWNADLEFPTFFQASWREPNESEFWVSGSSEPSGDDGTFGPDPYWFSDEGFVLKLTHATHWRPMFKPPHLAPLIAEAVKTKEDGES